MAAVRELADRYLDGCSRSTRTWPRCSASRAYDDRLTDYSPEGVAARAALARSTLAALDRTDVDRRRRPALRRPAAGPAARPSSVAFDADEHLRPLRIFGSPVSAVREVFDLTPRETPDDWANIAKRHGRRARGLRARRGGAAPGHGRRARSPRRARRWPAPSRRPRGPGWMPAASRGSSTLVAGAVPIGLRPELDARRGGGHRGPRRR